MAFLSHARSFAKSLMFGSRVDADETLRGSVDERSYSAAVVITVRVDFDSGFARGVNGMSGKFAHTYGDSKPCAS